MPFPGLLHSEPLPSSSPLPTHTSTGDTHTQDGLSLCGVSGSWYTQSLFQPSEHLWQVRGLILNAILPLLPSCWGFSFALGCGVSFFGGIQYSPVDSCSAASCNFGVLAEEDECTSFYSTILVCRIRYDYTVEVTNRFKGLDLTECLKNYGGRFMTFHSIHVEVLLCMYEYSFTQYLIC